MRINSAKCDEIKKAKTLQILEILAIIAISLFNPISFWLVFTICIGISYYVTNPIWEKTTSRIKEELMPLCDGDDYVYFSIEGEKIAFNYSSWLYSANSSSSAFDNKESELFDINYDRLDFLLYSEQYFFFLIENDNHYSIVKTDHDLNKLEILAELVGKISDEKHGYDSKFYFRLDGSCFVFDFSTNKMQDALSESEEERIITSDWAYYKKQTGFIDGSCSIRETNCIYKINDIEYVFDETGIDSTVYSLIKEFDFKPEHYLFCSYGVVCLLYYANMNFGDLYDCLAITYDTNSNSILNYQMFSEVSLSLFHLYPIIKL